MNCDLYCYNYLHIVLHISDSTYVRREEKIFVCDVCNKVFSKLAFLKRHYVIHTGEKNFECSVCGKRFNQKINLKVHMGTHLKHLLWPDGGWWHKRAINFNKSTIFYDMKMYDSTVQYTYCHDWPCTCSVIFKEFVRVYLNNCFYNDIQFLIYDFWGFSLLLSSKHIFLVCILVWYKNDFNFCSMYGVTCYIKLEIWEPTRWRNYPPTIYTWWSNSVIFENIVTFIILTFFSLKHE